MGRYFFNEFPFPLRVKVTSLQVTSLHHLWILSHTSHSQWKAETAFLNETTSFFAVFGRPGSPPCCMSCCSSAQPWNSCISVGSYCDSRLWSSLCILLLKMGSVQFIALENRFTWQCHAGCSFQITQWKCTTISLFLAKSHRPSSVPEVTNLKHILRGSFLVSRNSRNPRANCKNSLPHTPPGISTTGREESLFHLI